MSEVDKFAQDVNLKARNRIIDSVRDSHTIKKKSQDLSRALVASHMELVQAAKVVKRFAVDDASELTLSMKQHFDKILESEDDLAQFLGKVLPKAVDFVPTAADAAVGFDYDFRALESKYDQVIKDRLHSVWTRMDAAKKWDLDGKVGGEDDVIQENEDEDEKYLNWKCPISKNAPDDPLINPGCGHSYNKAAVEEFIKTKGKTGTEVRCPVRSCKEPLLFSKLKPNDDLVVGYQNALKMKNLVSRKGDTEGKKAKKRVVGDDGEEEEVKSSKKRKSS